MACSSKGCDSGIIDTLSSNGGVGGLVRFPTAEGRIASEIGSEIGGGIRTVGHNDGRNRGDEDLFPVFSEMSWRSSSGISETSCNTCGSNSRQFNQEQPIFHSTFQAENGYRNTYAINSDDYVDNPDRTEKTGIHCQKCFKIEDTHDREECIKIWCVLRPPTSHGWTEARPVIEYPLIPSNAKKKCCCVEKLYWVKNEKDKFDTLDEKPLTKKEREDCLPKKYQKSDLYGHRAIATVQMMWKEWDDTKKDGLCTVGWYEYSNIIPEYLSSKGVTPDKWFNMRTKIKNSCAFADWDKIIPGVTKDIKLPDSPSLVESGKKGDNASRDLKIVVRVTSAKGCGCEDPQMLEINFHQILKLKDGNVDVKNSSVYEPKGWFGKDTPKIPPNI